MSTDAPVKRGPGRPRKQTMEPAVIAEAEKAVAADPRGAPDTMLVDDESDAMPPTVPAAVLEVAQPLPVRAGRPCALDDAPVGSKIVVSKDTDSVKRVNLTMPTGVMLLPSEDAAYTLPVGAKIRRVMPSVFQATELNPAAFYPVLVTSTARDAIDRYREHFHKD